MARFVSYNRDGSVTLVEDARSQNVASGWTGASLASAAASFFTLAVFDSGLVDLVAMLQSNMPQPATSAPPPVQVDSTKGSAPRYALEDHTHQSRLQARRIQVTPNASGQYVYTFPLAYDVGVVPIVQVTCETPAGQTFRYDAGLLQGSTTNAQTTIVISKTNQNVVTGLLNAVLAVFTPATSALWINIMSRAPS